MGNYRESILDRRFRPVLEFNSPRDRYLSETWGVAPETDRFGNCYSLTGNIRRATDTLLSSPKPDKVILDLPLAKIPGIILTGIGRNKGRYGNSPDSLTRDPIFTVIDHHQVNRRHLAPVRENVQEIEILNPSARVAAQNKYSTGVLVWRSIGNLFKKDKAWYSWYRDLAFLSALADGTWVGAERIYDEVSADYPELFQDETVVFNGKPIIIKADFESWKDKPYLARLHSLGRLANRFNYPYYLYGDEGSQIITKYMLDLGKPLNLRLLAAGSSGNQVADYLNQLGHDIELKIHGMFESTLAREPVRISRYALMYTLEEDTLLARCLTGDLADLLAAEKEPATVIVKTPLENGLVNYRVRNRSAIMDHVNEMLLSKFGVSGQSSSFSLDIPLDQTGMFEEAMIKYFNRLEEQGLANVRFYDRQPVRIPWTYYSDKMKEVLGCIYQGDSEVVSHYDVDGITALVILFGAANFINHSSVLT